MEQDSNFRLSFAEQFNINELYKGILELSYKNTGDQYTQLKNTHDQMVLNHKWLSQTQYKEVVDLCWSLPGPTTFQIILTIVILKTKSIMQGLYCFIIYNFLPWVILTILGILSSIFIHNNIDQLPHSLRLFFLGFSAASAGLMMRSFFNYTSQNFSNLPKLLLTFLSAIIFFFNQSLISLFICLAMGGIVSLYLEAEDCRRKMSSKSYDLFKRIEFNYILGKPALVLLLSILFFMWIYFSIYTDHHYIYVFGFYLVSCLVIGPIDAIYAYFVAVLIPFGQLTPTQIWIGLPISFLLPGSHINVGIYFGAMIDGVRGAFLSAIFLYMPTFLSLLGLLPQWLSYRDRQGIHRLFDGLVCSATGLTLAMIMLILKHCIEVETATTICIFIISTYLNYFIGKFSFAIILIGGCLAYLRYISVVCYRYGQYCPFPFNF